MGVMKQGRSGDVWIPAHDHFIFLITRLFNYLQDSGPNSLIISFSSAARIYF